MSMERAAIFCQLLVAIILIARVAISGLGGPFRVLAWLTATRSVFTTIWLFGRYLPSLAALDFRIFWLLSRPFIWALTIVLLVLLLRSILENYPGIARLSIRVVQVAWCLSFLVGILSAIPEYRRAMLSAHHNFISSLSIFGLVGERVVFTVALLTLAAVLTFLLWFPVRPSRNLVYLSIGLMIFIFAGAVTLFTRNWWGTDIGRVVNVVGTFTENVCYLAWALFLTQAGTHKEAQLSRAWDPAEQERLLTRLELLNNSLVGAVRR